MSDITRERIQQRLDELGTTASVVSKAAGMDKSVVRKFMRGEIQELRDSNIRALAIQLKCSPAYLRGETDIIEDLDRSASNFFNRPVKNLNVKIKAAVEPGAFRPLNWFEGKDLGEIVNGLDPHFLHTKQYGYKVIGDEMADAGINDGDELVVVDHKEAEVELGDGDFVIVSVYRRSTNEQELTCRQLTLVGNQWWLAYRSKKKDVGEPIPLRRTSPNDDIIVTPIGIVCSIIRRNNLKRSARSAMRGVQAPPPKLRKPPAPPIAPPKPERKSASKAKKLFHSMAAALLMFAVGVAPCYACSVTPEFALDEHAHLYEDVGLQYRKYLFDRMNQAKAELVTQSAVDQVLARVST
jgi:SOS-response transcriptional repressor LexA